VTFAFESGVAPDAEDARVEPFAGRAQRADATTALWSTLGDERLKAGLGFGGDGSGGDPVFDAGATIELGGEDGLSGVAGSVLPRAGGAGGPGAGRGGDASAEGEGTVRGESGTAPAGTRGEGEGEASGPGPGGGGGGGHRVAGTGGRPGDDGEGSDGTGGLAYGDPVELFGGAGGGAGGNNTVPTEGGPRSSGGSGGGGGGAVLFEVGGRLVLRPNTEIRASGGDGGRGARPENGANSAAGGGGSGGTVVVRGFEIAGLSGSIKARGGRGGSALSPSGRGGSGSDGFIHIERVGSDPPPCGPPRCEPPASAGIVDPAVVGRSMGRSLFFDTNLREGEPAYAFDGADPATGEVRLGSEVQDVRVVDASGEPLDELPEGISIVVVWSGALEDPERLHQPDAATITPWLTDITELDGLPLIRFEVRFELDDEFVEQNAADFPGIDDLRFRLRR